MKARYSFVLGRKAKHGHYIELRATYNYKQVRISTGLQVRKDQWKGEVVNHESADNYNNHLRSMMRKIEDYEDRLRLTNQEFKVENISLALKSNTGSGDSFNDYIRQQIILDQGLSDSTYYNLNAALSALDKFKNTSFNEISSEWLRRFDNHLKSRGCQNNTIIEYHSRIHKYLLRAIEDDLFPAKNDPFRAVNIKKNPRKIKFLTKETIEKLMSLELEQRQKESLDVFIFSCYTGMGPADCRRFTKKHIRIEGGRKVIRMRRQKTDEEYIIPFFHIAEEIAERYNYKLPMGETYQIRLDLWAIGDVIGEHLHPYMARHTFAVWALENNVSMESLSHMMGHTDIKTTQIYGKITGRKVLADTSHLS